jgi:hypothetical protein
VFSRSRRDLDEPQRLPLGAEAALWSIVEVIPDPRNHLALTRDPTCEIRLSAAQIEAAVAAPVPATAASPVTVTESDLIRELFTSGESSLDALV